MINSKSCRAWGTCLTPISVCNICKEDISWVCGKCGVCGKCERLKDVTHLHDYCRIAYKEEEQIKIESS